MPTLELADVNSGYGGKEVLHHITFRAQEPAIYVVLGPNGAGKTTLFRTIAGILEPRSGHVLLDDRDLTRSREGRNRINYLSHYNAIPEEMTVWHARPVSTRGGVSWNPCGRDFVRLQQVSGQGTADWRNINNQGVPPGPAAR